MAADDRAVSLAEAAAITGVSVDTIRRWIAKGRLTKAQTNRPGIWIDRGSLEDATRQHSSAMQVQAYAQQSLRNRIAELEAANTDLASALDKAQAAAVEARTSAAVNEALAQERGRQLDQLNAALKALLDRPPTLVTTLRRWVARKLAGTSNE